MYHFTLHPLFLVCREFFRQCLVVVPFLFVFYLCWSAPLFFSSHLFNMLPLFFLCFLWLRLSFPIISFALHFSRYTHFHLGFSNDFWQKLSSFNLSLITLVCLTFSLIYSISFSSKQTKTEYYSNVSSASASSINTGNLQRRTKPNQTKPNEMEKDTSIYINLKHTKKMTYSLFDFAAYLVRQFLDLFIV